MSLRPSPEETELTNEILNGIVNELLTEIADELLPQHLPTGIVFAGGDAPDISSVQGEVSLGSRPFTAEEVMNKYKELIELNNENEVLMNEIQTLNNDIDILANTIN